MIDIPAGRELDELIATKLMGWEQGESWGSAYWVDSDGCIRFEIKKFKPSLYWEDMRLVVEEMHGRRGYDFTLEWYGNRYISWFGSMQSVGADTAPHAICLAALSALEGESE
ncbi:hypothetical protein [Paenibacillus sp. NEAU-GSW1]|uniref:BC1872 family protein n=1 Tax=Paenibacillus sp. NEAU-GSW1 TaxID=2682486 RepID=UPI0012E0C9C2|nr:hypothetical protein [Paenibacillus sp. NEAU-GSW1]MUT66043.1 hypothetical protein [Paenibacillus sp. NEAU-GSW1]